MSFIQKSESVVINSKLTNIGRLLLSNGTLTFKKLEFGDSEIDYTLIRDNNSLLLGTEFIVLRPKDANPNIKYPIPILDNSTETKTSISVQSLPSLVTNTATQRGFFTGSTSAGFTALTASTYIKGITTVNTSGVSGTNVFSLASVTNITADTMLLVDWRNPKLTSFSDLTGVIGESYPRQLLFYKVISVAGNLVTVDRPLPNFNIASTANKSLVYIYPPNNAIDNYYSTGTSISYWNDNTLAFNSNCNIASDDVKVWNFNIVYNKTPAGVKNDYIPQYYDSAIFAGFKEYIQGYSTNSAKTQFGIVHYTNKTISNYYGEGFNNNTFSLTLPTIMYHKKTSATMGIVLSASTIRQSKPTTLTGFTTEFYDLVETTSNITVGKVFNDLKIAVIEDEEILNALALKSDRSHTLPSPIWNTIAASTSASALLPALSTPNNYVALTYLFSSSSYNSNQSLGFKGGIHCGYIEKITQDASTAKNVTFQFVESDLKFMISSVAASVGTGFNVNNLFILAQKCTIGDEPNPKEWRLMDVTSRLFDYANWSTTTMPVSALTTQAYTINNDDYTGGTSYDISNIIGTLPTSPTYTDGLGFGEESILIGNINTDIKATVYKTKIGQNLNFNQYNTTVNPTYSFDEGNSDLFITEVGIYDDNNNLVAVGKLSNPLKKNSLRLLTVQIDMDF
jgi:hypothetical protein